MSFDILYEDDHFLVAVKPAGIPTHAASAREPGFVEQLSAYKSCRLGVHQRLDAATSGVIAFSKTEQGAQRLAKAFELRNVRKTYRAVVCGIPAQPSGTWQHRLEHRDGVTRESAQGKPCKSRYRIVATAGPFALLELDLLTGMTHQLRVQCALAGCPILGDSLYGGGDLAPRLCLHAHRLRILSEPNLPTMEAPLPPWFARLALADVLRALFQAVLRGIAGLPSDEAVRLAVPQHSGIPELILERLGGVLLVRHLEPDGRSLWTPDALRQAMSLAARMFGCTQTCYRVHESPSKSGACRALAREFSQQPAPFVASEHGIRYRFDLAGNATGLYLDQRENRRWVMEHAHGLVINLFAYTCAFSVCAAKSDAVTGTVSIDAAAAALRRGRENFDDNGILADGHRFITEDAQKYLRRCAQNGTAFDTVICDPPSFGRAGKAVFRLEDELEALLEACVRVAASGATILFSINHRGIRLSRLRAAWKRAFAAIGRPAPDAEIFVNDDALGPLGVGTDLKTIRCLRI